MNKKTIYLFLCGISLISAIAVGYYAFLTSLKPTITAQEKINTVPSTGKEYITKTGKTFIIEETHPNGESLSTITVTGKGFLEAPVITFEKNKLERVFLSDLNMDGFEELYIVTQSAGSGSYGDVTAIISDQDMTLSKVDLPEVAPEEKLPGGLFEGYEGHDSYSIRDNFLVRSFALYNATDTNSTPTGAKGDVEYVLFKDGDTFSFKIVSGDQSTTTDIVAPPSEGLTRVASTASTTDKKISQGTSTVSSSTPSGKTNAPLTTTASGKKSY